MLLQTLLDLAAETFYYLRLYAAACIFTIENTLGVGIMLLSWLKGSFNSFQ